MKHLLAFLTIILVSGCSTLIPMPENVSRYEKWEVHKARLLKLEHWELHGRIFIQAKNDGFSSTIHWKQQGQTYELGFTAPFNQGIYKLRGSPEKVSIVLPDSTIRNASDPESLIKETLGFHFPISGLSYWVRGLPWPKGPSRNIILDQNERLAELSQAGWHIKISRYIHIRDIYLPSKLMMENRYLKIKMVVKEWIIPNPK